MANSPNPRNVAADPKGNATESTGQAPLEEKNKSSIAKLIAWAKRTGEKVKKKLVIEL